MTESQIKAGIGYIATVVLTIIASVNPYLPLLPEKYKWIGTAVLVMGAICTGIVPLANQSWSSKHVSVPKSKAKKVIKENPAAAEKLGLIEKLEPLDEVTHRKGK